MDFHNRNVFVAGGTSGINLGIAQAFSRAGARVAVLSRNPERVSAAAGLSCASCAVSDRLEERT